MVRSEPNHSRHCRVLVGPTIAPQTTPGAMMSRLVLGAVVVCACAGVALAGAPNILVILTDDQGIGDYTLAGHNCDNSTGMCAHTPNMDKLVLSPGTAHFDRFYSAAGVCSPTVRARPLASLRDESRGCFNILEADEHLVCLCWLAARHDLDWSHQQPGLYPFGATVRSGESRAHLRARQGRSARVERVYNRQSGQEIQAWRLRHHP